MASPNPTAIPDGSLVLITGATSYLASYAIKDLLERGYRVRGVVRDLAKAAWLTEEVFPSFAQSGTFDLVEVPDLFAQNAFDTVVANGNLSAILHFATPFDFSPDPNEVIPQAINAVLGLLRTAAREPSVKRFVYTSSIGAAYSPKGGVRATITTDSWNDAAVDAAWAPPPYKQERGPLVYAASKVEAERAMFRFMEDEKPGFSATAVNPFYVVGPVLHERYYGHSTAGLLRNLYNGEPGMFAIVPPGCQVDVRDVAALHVAAALDPDVKGERLLAWAGPFNMNLALSALRREYPDREFIEDGPSQPLCLATIGDEERLKGLLKKWGGRDGWIPLEQTVRDAVNPEPKA